MLEFLIATKQAIALGGYLASPVWVFPCHSRGAFSSKGPHRGLEEDYLSHAGLHMCRRAYRVPSQHGKSTTTATGVVVLPTTTSPPRRPYLLCTEPLAGRSPKRAEDQQPLRRHCTLCVGTEDLQPVGLFARTLSTVVIASSDRPSCNATPVMQCNVYSTINQTNNIHSPHIRKNLPPLYRDTFFDQFLSTQLKIST